ncbi:MAG: hypothetical protein ACM3P0_14260 [Acidobacteriota bacterium]
MKIKFLLPLVILSLALAVISCADDNGVFYNNPNDPFSSNYEPGAPDSLEAVVLSDSGIALCWKSTSLKEDGFRIFSRKGIIGDLVKIAEVPARTTTYFDRFQVHSGVTYYYQVASFNKNIRGNYSKEINVQMVILPPVLNLKETNSNSVTLEWNNPGFMKANFVLERSVNGGPFVQLANPGSDVFSYTDTDLDRKDSYSYRIKGVSGTIESEYSEILTLSYTLCDLKKIKSVDLGNPVHSLVFSPDGTKLAAAGMSYSVRVWNAYDGTLLWDLGNKGPNITSPGYPFQVAFSCKGNLLAANADPKTSSSIMKIWRMSDGALVRGIPAGSSPEAVRSICFSGDESKIMAGNLKGEVNTWSLTDGKFIRKDYISNSSSYVTFLYTTHDGSKIITGVQGFPSPLRQGIQIWAAGTWSYIAHFSGFDSEYYAISNAENYFACNGIVVSLSTGETIAGITGYPYITNSQECFSSDEKILLGRFSSVGLKATLISNTNVTVSKPVPLPGNSSYPAIAASPKGDLFAISGEQAGIVEFWEIVRGWRKVP